MFHKGAKWVNSALHPTMNDTIIPETNVTIKGQGVLEFGVKYLISGFGEGYPDEEGNRKELWVIINKYNTEVPPIHIFKKDLNSLYERELITVL